MTANQNEELVGFRLFEVNLALDIEVGVLFEILMRCGVSDIWPCLALFFHRLIAGFIRGVTLGG
jgi:hypothetical protein